LGHQPGFSQLWPVGLGHRYEPQQKTPPGRIGTSTRASANSARQIGTSTRATTTHTTDWNFSFLFYFLEKEKERKVPSQQAANTKGSLLAGNVWYCLQEGQDAADVINSSPKKGWVHPPHPTGETDAQVNSLRQESRLEMLDVACLLEGNDTNCAINFVPKKDGFSPVSSSQ